MVGVERQIPRAILKYSRKFASATHARRNTPRHTIISGVCEVSSMQSTRPRGARRDFVCLHFVSIYQSTRPRGARLGGMLRVNTGEAFQSTRPQGARHPSGHPLPVYRAISIHAPVKGATLKLRFPAAPGIFQSTRLRGARPVQIAMMYI